MSDQLPLPFEPIKVRTCQDCNTASPSVRETLCPFAAEIHEKAVSIVVCDDCYRERLHDI